MTPAEVAPASALRSLLDDGLQAMGLELESSQRDKLLGYVSLLEKWNKVYNLTAVRERERMVSVHILDSLSVLPHLSGLDRILDVGTGGGLPGIPIAIARADIGVTMLDSLQKKTTFVRQCIGELGLSNAHVICERVEQYSPAQPYQAIISRAFAEIIDFVKGAGHLVTPGGRMLAMKGVYPHDEIARLPDGFAVVEVIELTVPQVEGMRHLVVIGKK